MDTRKSLQRVVQLYRGGLTNHRDMLLEAGLEAARFIDAKVQTRKTRASAILNLRTALSKVDGRSVDVNAMIKASYAAKMLGLKQSDWMPYRYLRVVFSIFVQRVGTSYHLREEAKAKQLFRLVLRKRLICEEAHRLALSSLGWKKTLRFSAVQNAIRRAYEVLLTCEEPAAALSGVLKRLARHGITPSKKLAEEAA